ncbi:MAG: 3-hydroxyacyl-[acyl-carrier-protein] dehydratase FabZ [Nitrospirae bacterium]|nr:MAG: 3-hydroxyacyl-[acyl-carrier-protein] dehydratase FabZ [Nitrospirota bacterium]
MIDIKEIMGMLPHRYPFLLVDRVVEVEEGKRAVGIKNVTINEPFFQGHFPGNPIMPGVLIVEAMAQVSGVLAYKSGVQGKSTIFLSIEKAKFRKPVTPGDQLRLEVETLRGRQTIWRFAGKAFVEDTLVAEAEFTAMVTDREI